MLKQFVVFPAKLLLFGCCVCGLYVGDYRIHLENARPLEIHPAQWADINSIGEK